MSKTIEKKTWPDMFEKILNGEKNFDLRLADFDISQGDCLVLREWDPREKNYTGRQIVKQVGFVLKTKDLKYWQKKEIDKHGFIVMSLI